jgi:hypothetical protein
MAVRLRCYGGRVATKDHAGPHTCLGVYVPVAAHRLDISDEFKAVMSTLRGHDDKV